jgi:hypothetical protein
MDFDFSDDQEQLRDAVRKWVDKGYDFERRRTRPPRRAALTATAYTELAELGLCGLYISEDHGGLGMGPVEGMVVMEELGRGIVLEPLAQTLIAAACWAAMPRPVKDAWLGKIAGRRSPGGAGPPGAQGALPPGRVRCNQPPCRPAPAGPERRQEHRARGRPGRRLPGARHGQRQDGAVPRRARRQRRQHPRLCHAGRQPRRRVTLANAPATLVTPTA